MPSTLFGAEIITDKIKAKPFLKWAGGKGQLLGEIERRLPEKLINGQIDTYIEPFVGGGAVFFHIAQNYPWLKHFYLFDINEDLVNCYNEIKNNVKSLIKQLQLLEKRFLPLDKEGRKHFFYKTRTKFNRDRQSAKLIFLNKTCYNGLYRVNRKGEFNVPFGDYKSPNICDAKNILSVASILKRAEIICGDFTESYRCINENTFVYFDPPYRPLSATASFTSYSKEDFSHEDQVRLANFCKQIKKQGARLLLSNSDPKNENPKDYFFENNYPEIEGFTIERVKASRAINCKGHMRGPIYELIITSY